jgi:hypothetical protein
MAVTTTSLRQGKFETRFWHKIFEEEVGRVKGHFGPLNTCVPSFVFYASLKMLCVVLLTRPPQHRGTPWGHRLRVRRGRWFRARAPLRRELFQGKAVR